MRPLTLAVLFLALTAPRAVAQDLDPSLSQAQASFRTHQPGQPYADQTVALPPAADSGQKSQVESLSDLLAQIRRVQEGCAAPCSSSAQVKAYLDDAAEVASRLGLASEIPALREHYAPAGVPRLKTGPSSAGGPASAAHEAQSRALRERQAAAAGRADQLAAALNVGKNTQALPADGGPGAAVKAKASGSEPRKADLDGSRRAAVKDSSQTRRLTLKPPPDLRTGLPVTPAPRSVLDRVLDRIGTRVDSPALDARISRGSALGWAFASTVGNGFGIFAGAALVPESGPIGAVILVKSTYGFGAGCANMASAALGSKPVTTGALYNDLAAWTFGPESPFAQGVATAADLATDFKGIRAWPEGREAILKFGPNPVGYHKFFSMFGRSVDSKLNILAGEQAAQALRESAAPLWESKWR